MIIDECLVDHCRMLTRDYHLDDRLSLSHVSRRRRPRVGAINDVQSCMARPRMTGHNASHRSYVEDKLSKKTILAPYLETPKISPSKVEKTTYGTESSTIIRRPARDTCPQAKYIYIYIFLIGDFLVDYTISCYTFLESSDGAYFKL